MNFPFLFQVSRAVYNTLQHARLYIDPGESEINARSSLVSHGKLANSLQLASRTFNAKLARRYRVYKVLMKRVEMRASAACEGGLTGAGRS